MADDDSDLDDQADDDELDDLDDDEPLDGDGDDSELDAWEAEDAATADALADALAEEVVALQAERDELRAELAKLKGEKPAAAAKPKPAEKPKPAAKPGPVDGKFNVSRAQLRDPKWMRANQAAYVKALKAGTVNYLD